MVYHTGEIRLGLKLFQRVCEEAGQVGNLVTLSVAASGLYREFAYLRDAAENLHWESKLRELPSK